VDLLISEGANVNAQADDGVTALHVAAATGNRAVVQSLLQSKHVKKNAQLAHSGFTALHLAVSSADVETVCALLDHDAGYNEAACHGITPVHVAAHLGLPDILQRLLKANLVFPQNDPPTALHLTTCKPQLSVVEPVLKVVSVVDWLGPVQMKPQLLRALITSAPEHLLAAVGKPEGKRGASISGEHFVKLSRPSFVAANARAVQNSISRRAQLLSLPEYKDNGDSDMANAGSVDQPKGCLQVRCAAQGWLRTLPLTRYAHPHK
jgi:hypothetical protein